MGQTFTFPRPNERRLMSVEADQAPTSQECQKRSFLRSETLDDLDGVNSASSPGPSCRLAWAFGRTNAAQHDLVLDRGQAQPLCQGAQDQVNRQCCKHNTHDAAQHIRPASTDDPADDVTQQKDGKHQG
jgi:hypothetical protein